MKLNNNLSNSDVQETPNLKKTKRLPDDTVDAIALLCFIAIVLCSIVYWLYNI